MAPLSMLEDRGGGRGGSVTVRDNLSMDIGDTVSMAVTVALVGMVGTAGRVAGVATEDPVASAVGVATVATAATTTATAVAAAVPRSRAGTATAGHPDATANGREVAGAFSRVALAAWDLWGPWADALEEVVAVRDLGAHAHQVSA